MSDYTILVDGLPLVVQPADSIFKALAGFVQVAECKEWGAFIKVIGSTRGVFAQYEAMKLMVRPC